LAYEIVAILAPAMTPARRAFRSSLLAPLGAALLALAACRPHGAQPCAPVATATPPAEIAPTAADAAAFVQKTNDELRRLVTDADHAAWVKATYINADSEYLEAKAREAMLEFATRTVKEAQRFAALELPPETARALYLIKFMAGVPAPSDPVKRARLAEIATALESTYGKGKYCSPNLKGKGDDK
jgi:peptidyl-dipeptidase A